VLAGWSFVRGRSRLLGVILLDLFVILLGGATALLPVYARDILAVGPSGLGAGHRGTSHHHRALAASNRAARGPGDVHRGRTVRLRHHGVRIVDILPAVARGAGDPRRLRRRQRRATLLPGANRDARPDARP